MNPFLLTQWLFTRCGQLFLFLFISHLAVVESNSEVLFSRSPRGYSSVSTKEPSLLVLAKGEYYFYPHPKTKIIHNASGKILQVIDEGKHLRLLGKSHGFTQIGFDKQIVQILVTTRSQKNLYTQMKNYLHRRPGLFLVGMDPCHQIQGELLRWEDWVALKNMAKKNQACFSFEAKIAPEITQEVNQQLSVQWQRSLWGPPRIIQSESLTIEFPENAKEYREAIESELRVWGLSPQFSKNAVDLKPMIRTKILITEINRQRAERLGVSWPDSYQARLLPDGQIKNDWEIELKAIEDQGEGKILAQPSLLSRSGEPAEFLAGGEIPLRLTKNHSREVVWKRYGININVTAHADPRGYLKTEIKVEVSSPDSSFSADGLPAFKTHRLQSQFNLRQARTIVLSGLLRQEQGKGQSGLPLLSQLPVLGQLFSSRQFLTNQSELVILVTPVIIDEFSSSSEKSEKIYSLPSENKKNHDEP